MEDVIRQGALRLLTSEESCDVVLCCGGRRLMAHKVILSIASPLLQSILLEENSTPAIIILPEIQTSIMTLILDYIYTGNAHVPQENLKDFLDAASLLRIKIYDETKVDENWKMGETSSKTEENPYNIEKTSIFEKNLTKIEETPTKHKEKPSRKTSRKVPNLLPISALTVRKSTYSHVIPSPWCPRIAPLMGDPRIDPAIMKVHSKELDKNDTNNNFQIMNFVRKRSITGCTKFAQPKIAEEQPKKTDVDPNTDESVTMTDEDVAKVHEQPTKSHEQLTKSYEEPTKSSHLETKLPDDVPKTVDDNSKTDRRCQSKPFKCEECGKCFSQLRNYKYHRSIHEGTKEFSARCPECGKTFNDKGYLSSHMKIHRDRKEYGCPHCPKRFNQRVAYNMHLRIHTGVKPHECPTCGKTFSRKMLLKQHQRVHTGERPYSCPECGKTFADRSNMSLHARLHTGVKPYSCSLCSKSFTKKHHLKTHMNFHTGLKPYSCQNCGLSFSQSSNMRTHYKKCILKPSSENENP